MDTKGSLVGTGSVGIKDACCGFQPCPFHLDTLVFLSFSLSQPLHVGCHTEALICVEIVQVSAPHGVTEYVKATMEFANWAFMTPEAREDAERGRRAVQVALAATKCITAVCDYAITSKLPAEVAAEYSGGPSSRDGVGNGAAEHGIPLETPALAARPPETCAVASSCGDPPTGWTVSMHGGPQRAFASIASERLQQENVAPKTDARHQISAKAPDAMTSSRVLRGHTTREDSGQDCLRKSVGHGSPAPGQSSDMPNIGVPWFGMCTQMPRHDRCIALSNSCAQGFKASLNFPGIGIHLLNNG